MANKKIVIIIIVVLALVAGVVVWVSLVSKDKQKNEPTIANIKTKTDEQQAPLKVKQNDVAVTELPKEFPSEIPMEKGAVISQNYNATAENGIFQATRVFETSLSLDHNFKIYSDFITKKDWKLVTSLNQDNIKVLSASKGKGNLQITMSENSVTKVRTVELSYSEQK